LLNDGERQRTALPGENARFFVRILNHAHVVDRIFIGHPTGKPHGFDAENTVAPPPSRNCAQRSREPTRG
jgi:hypothetical protein